MYAQFNQSGLNQFYVDPSEPYEEPQVFEQDGSVLTLSNYQFAYGNSISDQVDNPFVIDVLQQTQHQTVLEGSPSHEAMSQLLEESGHNKKPDQYSNPFEQTSYRTYVDKSGYYSYYTRGLFSSYQSYEYSGRTTQQTFDQYTGQKCYYENSYQGWSQYGLDNYECSRETELFVMQNQTFKVIGLVFGFLFAFTAAFVAFGLHCCKLQYSQKYGRLRVVDEGAAQGEGADVSQHQQVPATERAVTEEVMVEQAEQQQQDDLQRAVAGAGAEAGEEEDPDI